MCATHNPKGWVQQGPARLELSGADGDRAKRGVDSGSGLTDRALTDRQQRRSTSRKPPRTRQCRRRTRSGSFATSGHVPRLAYVRGGC